MKQPLTPEHPRAIQIGTDHNCPDGKTSIALFRVLTPEDENPAYPRLAVLHDQGGFCWTLLSTNLTPEKIVGENGEPAENLILRHPQETFRQREFRRATDLADNRYIKSSTHALPLFRQINDLVGDAHVVNTLTSLYHTAEHPDVYEAGIVDEDGYPTRQALADRHPESEYFVGWDNGHSTAEGSFAHAMGTAGAGCEPHGTRNARVYDAVPDDGRILQPYEFVLRAEVTIPNND